MSSLLAMNRVRILQRWILCLAFVSVCLPNLEVRSQGVVTGDLLSPPRSNLVPVHWPDLSKLDVAVREQLISSQASLAVTVTSNRDEGVLSNAYGTMGQIYHVYSLNSPARECYLNATRLKPQDFRWAYLLGKLDEQEDRFDDALRSYQIARTLRPDYAAVPVNLGNIYLQLDQLEDAKKNFDAALVIDSSSAAALYGLGQVFMAQRNYSQAISYFEKALALIPAATRIHYSLAMAYRGMGNREKATAHLAKQGSVGVRVKDPLFEELQELIRSERIYLIRGKLALESQRFSEARDEFRKALAANQNSVPAHVNLGAVLISLGDLKGAAEQYEEALRIDSNNANAHYNLAILLSKEGKREQIIEHLQAVIRIDPNDVNAAFFLAGELAKSNRTEEALAEFSRVAQLDPDNEAALLEQVKLLQQTRQYKQALEVLEKGHARNPTKGQTIVMLARLLAVSPLYDLRDGERALKLAQMVYTQTGALEHGAIVAMALAELGRCVEAAEWQRRLIAVAEREQKAEQLAQLKNALKQYEKGPPCRPESEPGANRQR